MEAGLCYLQFRKSGVAMQGDMKLCTWGARTGLRWMAQLTHSKQGERFGGSLAFDQLNELYGLQDVEPIP